MATFAKIENGIVVEVNVTMDSDQTTYSARMMTERGEQWVQTSYNTLGNVHKLGGTPFRKNYAGKGYTFDGVGFAAPKPYASWTLDSDTYLWNAPTPMPVDGKLYSWDEATLAWGISSSYR